LRTRSGIGGTCGSCTETGLRPMAWNIRE
jgi:hypothetical protein